MLLLKRLLPLILLCILLPGRSIALPPKLIHYHKTEVMIPMRDGVRLFTKIYTPDSTITDTLPILMMRSPYYDWNIGTISPEYDSYVANLAQGGYIFVYQNIRGKQKSEGEFVMERPFNKRDKGIDEASDTYDTIDWLLKNIKSNGRVGQLGISYPGELTLISGIKPHPALKAVSPQGTVGDFFLGDDFFHNGAFRLSFGFEYSFGEEASKGDTVFPFPEYDLFDWYLHLGALSNVNKKYFHGQIPTWNDFIKHPGYDSYWRDKSPLNYTDTPVIPILHVGGYWDQENMFGPEALYAKMEKYDTKNLNYIILGPWCHGQWSDSNASTIGSYNMRRNTADDFRAIQKVWFDYWLKGIGDGKFPEATCYQTGTNTWQHYTEWPPKDVTKTRLYLEDSGRLSFEKPGNAEKYDSYISDPANPILYRRRPIEVTYSDSSNWDTWLTEDQRQVDHRPDMLSYVSNVLDSDVTVTGDIMAHIFASITGSDIDWICKLIDVYPDFVKPEVDMSQYELIIASDIFRGRYRNSFSKPEPIPSGPVIEYKFDLHQVNHVFKKGHRMMVQVQSSWFPIFDRNPQKYVPNIFLATEKDYIKSTQHVYHGGAYSSYIELPLPGDKPNRVVAKKHIKGKARA